MKTYQWGIAGTGDIAHSFASVFDLPNSQLHSIASRTLTKGQEFADQYDIELVFDDYDAFLADPQLDIVYIAVPNRQHHRYIMKALNAGKHVLCEKAITTNLTELEEAMALATEKNLILQEAMTIFNMPLYHELRRLMDSGKLGTLKMIQAPFGSYKEPNPQNRFFNPELGGGALLDIGTYAVSFARWFMKATPTLEASSMIPFETGVDESSISILKNDQDEMAAVTLTFQGKMPKVGIVSFDNAYLTINDYPRADQAQIFYNDGTTEFIESGTTTNALNYEAENMIKTIEGAPNRSLFLTKDVISILSQMQAAWRSSSVR